MSGNGWVTCEQGHRHRGLFGAAGLLACAPDPADPAGCLVLMRHRAGRSHQVDQLALHPGFAETWPQVRAVLLRLTGGRP